MRVGILTSGGDCQGLNAAIRGVAKTLYQRVSNLELYGISNGYQGLIEGKWKEMKEEEFSGILCLGGTILGTSRQPFKKMLDPGEDGTSKLDNMLKHYKQGGFDALVILGGNGSHKTANLLAQNGVNVVTMPKTIDNDLYGTDLTFGFDSAVRKASSVIDAIHTTAASHSRIFIIELMGHKVGWVTLYAGIAAGADAILIPEIPYDVHNIANMVQLRHDKGKLFSIIAIAEGALTKEEAALSKKERKELWKRSSAASRLEKPLEKLLKQDIRTAIPGHYQRGGAPTATDRLLCSRLGAKAGELVSRRQFGYMAAVRDGQIVAVPLSEVAGKLKYVSPDSEIVHQARMLGISFGDC